MNNIKVTHYMKDFLFNGRAYMSLDNSEEEIDMLMKEMEEIESKHIIIFQLEALYDYYKHRGLPSNTVEEMKKLEVGANCLIRTNKEVSAKITRLSKNFCTVEWIW